MQTIASTDIQNLFIFYRNSVFSISNNLQFWKGFLDSVIEKYKDENKERKLFESIFSVYDLSPNSSSGVLKTHRKVFDISTLDLSDYRKRFFSWVMNFSIVKAYNSCELLLLRIIQLEFYPESSNPLENKKYADNIHKEIKQFLVKADSKNNRHIIEFLKQKSNLFKEFSTQEVRLESGTNWAQFFEFISILRHIVVHHGAIVHLDTHNQIKSKAKQIFEDFFNLQDENGYNILEPKEGDYFLNFLNLINDFSLNTVKFVVGKNDLSFLGMQ